jgi:hypothetical protein
MKAVRAAAKGGKIGRIERVEISHETTGGKVIKLDKPITHYAMEIVKDDKTSPTRSGAAGEVVVTSDGTRVAEAADLDATK